jgi:hypothetical protein
MSCHLALALVAADVQAQKQGYSLLNLGVRPRLCCVSQVPVRSYRCVRKTPLHARSLRLTPANQQVMQQTTAPLHRRRWAARTLQVLLQTARRIAHRTARTEFQTVIQMVSNQLASQKHRTVWRR